MGSTTRDIYPEANMIACIEDSKLLRQTQYESLFEADGLLGALDELNRINYFHTYHRTEPGNFASLLDGLMQSTLKLLRDIAPTPVIWRMFALYYDVHNMKLAAKERFWGSDHSALALSYGSYSFSTIRSAAVRPSDNILRSDPLTEGFYTALRARSGECDRILDGAYLRALRYMADELGVSGIADFVTSKIDLHNIASYFQMQASDASLDYFYDSFSDQGTSTIEDWQEHIHAVQYGQRSPNEILFMDPYRSIWEGIEDEQELFRLLDVRIDNYLIGKTKASKLMAFGIQPICAVFFNKLMEIKNIRVLLVCKKNGYGVEAIKKRMRITYDL